MKYKKIIISFFTVYIIGLFSAYTQCIVTSNEGYSVYIAISPTHIVPTQETCSNGYNYNVAYNYEIIFSGSNIPDNLYTLQGNINCNSQNSFFDLPNAGGSGTGATVGNQWSDATDCNTATPESLQCTVIIIEVAGIGIPHQFIECASAQLPITLSYFSATPIHSSEVELTWTTESEINNDFFTVLRSQNGLDWDNIYTKPGAGNSSTPITYFAYDKTPFPGISYYKLQQTDYDKTSSFSSIETVFIHTNNAQDINYSYNRKEQTLHIKGEKKDLESFRIISIDGKDITSSVLLLKKTDSSIKIHTGSIAKGIYILKNSQGTATLHIQ